MCRRNATSRNNHWYRRPKIQEVDLKPAVPGRYHPIQQPRRRHPSLIETNVFTNANI